MTEFTGRGLGKSVDWWLIVCYLMLIFFGWINIYSADVGTDTVSIFSLSIRSGKQFIWMMVSLGVGALILFLINPRLWEVLSTPGYLVIILALVAVLLMGSTIKGSKSWLTLGPVSFQPAEISKITTALMLSLIMSQQGFKFRDWKFLLLSVGAIGLPMVLILLEKETGLVLVYAGFLLPLYREGMSGWLIYALLACIVIFILALKFPLWAPLAGVAVAVLIYFLANRPYVGSSKRARRKLIRESLLALAGGAAVSYGASYAFEKFLRGYQKMRVEVLLGITEDPSGIGYNVRQSMIAIGSGGVAGKGFLQGTQTSLGFVPEQATDFIFCTIGEEWGFIGCALVLFLFCFMIFRIIIDAEECREAFTRIYGYCVAGFLFMHMVINVGMTIGLMPVIGITLPFISYGGSSLLGFTVLLFIFIALHHQEKRYF